MNPKPILTQSILGHLAEEAIPSAEIDLWPALQARLGTSKHFKPRGVFRMNIKLRFAVVALLVLLLVVGFLVATPQGRALAQEVLGYFKTTKEEHPTPTPTPEPSYMISAKEATVQPTPAVDPNLCGPTVSLVSSTFPCQLINAEAEMGFELKTFPADRIQLSFHWLFVFPDPKEVDIGFMSGNGATSEWAFYIIAQGMGDFPANVYDSPVVPEEAVQQVLVGDHPAEYYSGGHGGLYDDILRWKESGRWFEIYRFGPQEGMKETLIQLAENLVTASQGIEKLAGADTPTVAQRSGFDLMEPTVMPDIFQFCGAHYIGLEGPGPYFVILQYCLWQSGMWKADLTIFESPVSYPVSFPEPSLVDSNWHKRPTENVQIGNVIGLYLVNDREQALIWTEGDLRLMIVFTWTPSYGGRLGKEDLIAIAESMK